MNLLLLLAHSIEEYDQVRLLSSLGYDVFSIGAYTDPVHPTDDKRPALPDVAYHADLAALVEGDQMAHKTHLPDGLIDWADAIIVHHFPDSWIAGQWDRIRHKRVVWRTVGQSDFRIETIMGRLRQDGLQIVRYSPAEWRAFRDEFAGEDALIRFWKDPDEWDGWTGESGAVVNVTQQLIQRGEFTNGQFWVEATKDLPAIAIGEGSEVVGGMGVVPYERMKAMLRVGRAYLYTGTQPASYTLGLLEAMMTGIPIVSIGPGRMWIPDLFEGHELAWQASDSSREAHEWLRALLSDDDLASAASVEMRARALALFSPDVVGRQWRDFLGEPTLSVPEIERRIGAVA